MVLESGADANLVVGETTALIEAVKNAHGTMVELLLNSNVYTNAIVWYLGRKMTALIKAVNNKHETMVELLLKSNIDANAVVNGTVLIEAATRKDLSIAEILV